VKLDDLREALDRYCSMYPSDAVMLDPARRGIAEGHRLFDREETRGHCTVNALVVKFPDQVLMVHHRASGRWLTPGGHVETSDLSLRLAALRELREEVGLRSDDVELLEPDPVDMIVHRNPACWIAGKRVAYHIDVKFLFSLRDEALTPAPAPREVDALEWRAFSLLPGERLASKIKSYAPPSSL
jgi:8-oxo-dGTP pyrophosphatase MutT (NUDIX family)